MAYLFSHEDQRERERLAAIEAVGDPFTIECLESIGVGDGWNCLEIGAGGGSMTEWLCNRVGPEGRVVATDLQTKFLEAIDAANLEVRRHDISEEDLGGETFDVGLNDADVLASFERHCDREIQNAREEGREPCLMGAEDRWRWTGSEPSGGPGDRSNPPCRCKFCKDAGLIRIGH